MAPPGALPVNRTQWAVAFFQARPLLILETQKDDQKRKSIVEAKNQGESLIHAIEKSIKELGDKAPEAEKSAAEAAMADLRTALNGEDVEDIKAKTEALGQASMKIGEILYRNQQENDSSGAANDTQASDTMAAEGDPNAKPADVIDAEFTDVDDDKKANG